MDVVSLVGELTFLENINLIADVYEVFSAPNYVDTSGNKGAYINIGPDYKLQHNVFDAVEHPPIKAMAYAQSPLMSMM